MKSSRLLLAAAALTTVAFAAQADDADASQYFNSTVPTAAAAAPKTRADVQAELAQYKKSGVNPWSTSFNQLAGFQSSKTRAQAQGEYIANRDAVRALNGEDSGSAYLASRQATPATRFAAQPGATVGE